MTRTVVVGRADEKQKEIYGIVLEAQLAGLEACRSGVRGCDVDKVSRDIIAKVMEIPIVLREELALGYAIIQQVNHQLLSQLRRKELHDLDQLQQME